MSFPSGTVWPRLRSFSDSPYTWHAIAALAVVLRLRQYVANRSFWADETALALNLTSRSFAGLTHPLDHNQYAPLGFLFIEKAVLLLLGNRDYILRLVPFISGILAVYLMLRISKAQLGKTGLFALLLFAVSWPLIYYSSELKQYSSDVLVALALIYYFSAHLRERTILPRAALGLGLVGAIAIWFSHPSIFILAAIDLALFFQVLMKRTNLHAIWPIALGAAWLIDFSVNYLAFLRDAAAGPYLQSFWRQYFMPFPPWMNGNWFIANLGRALGFSFGSTTFPPVLLIAACALLILIGVLAFALESPDLALLVLLPAIFTSLASSLGRYPIYDRFILFLIPLAFLLIAKGLQKAYAVLGQRHAAAGALLCGLTGIVILWEPAGSAFSYFRTPYAQGDIKPLLSYIDAKIGSNDVIYVYSGNGIFSYYAAAYGLESRVVSQQDKGPADIGAFADDTKQLAGKRVWFLFLHSGEEREAVVKYLYRHAQVLDKFFSPGIYAYLGRLY